MEALNESLNLPNVAIQRIILKNINHNAVSENEKVIIF